MTMKKIGFVTPWYGGEMQGGAEKEINSLMQYLKHLGVNLEVLTTCCFGFHHDWQHNFFSEGDCEIDGMTVKRFPLNAREAEVFNNVNQKILEYQKISKEEQQAFLDNFINSEALYNYIYEHKEDYAFFVTIPYMVSSNIRAIEICPEKFILIPCFHDEPYIYLDAYKAAIENLAGIIYHAKPEFELANKVFDFKNTEQATLGEIININFYGDGARFVEKYKIEEPFILYAGRKDKEKNVDTLIDYMCRYWDENPDNTIHLVMIGGGELCVPDKYKEKIHDLGYVSEQDKYDAYFASSALCQPSERESFSIVIMEEWVAKKPVIVNRNCNVTSYFVEETKGGFCFDDYLSFAKAVNDILYDKKKTKKMGKLGNKYVVNNFSKDTVVQRYRMFFVDINDKINGKEGGGWASTQERILIWVQSRRKLLRPLRRIITRMMQYRSK